MNMRPLDAEMDDTEVLAPGGGERGLADRLVDASAAQVADRCRDPQRDVDGIPGMEVRTLLVWRTRPRVLRRATCATPFAAALLPQDQLLGLAATAARRVPGEHAIYVVPDSSKCN